MKKNNQSSEHNEQSLLFQWAKLNEKKYPALNMMFSVPNGGKLPYTKTGRGKIWSPQRLSLVQEGLKKGVPDIFIAWPTKLYHGFFIEMKYGKNTTSEEQKMWITKLESAGYAVAICWSFEEARDKVIDYINGY